MRDSGGDRKKSKKEKKGFPDPTPKVQRLRALKYFPRGGNAEMQDSNSEKFKEKQAQTDF